MELNQHNQEAWILFVAQDLLKKDVWPNHISDINLDHIDLNLFKLGTKLFIHYLKMMNEMSHNSVNMEKFQNYWDFQVENGFSSFAVKSLKEIAIECIRENCRVK